MVAVDGDIELEIGSGSGDYTVRVVSAPSGGETSGRFRLDVAGILARLPDLEATVLASTVTARRTIPVAEKPLHEVGERLFQALFAGPVHGTYRASLGAAQHSGRPLRVVLRLAAPELAALPWELLFDPETGSYLCQDMPLLRRIPATDYNPRPLEVVPPLRILGIVASPHDLPRLDTDAEKQHLAEAMAEPVSAGLIELAWAPEATWDGIQSTLLDGPWHVLHFIGHGDYDPHGQEGRVALESPAGRTDMVRASSLMQLLREAEPTPRLVVLNSCSSGEAGTEDLFSGTAAALVRGGISAVAAMQFTVSDAAAIAFARGFYGAIAHGRDIDRAAGSGRRSIMGLGTLEWVTPVLYVRGGSTELFTLTRAPVPVRPVPTEPKILPLPEWPEQRQAAQLRALYLQAGAELRMKQYGAAISLLDNLLTLEPGYRDAAELRKTARQRGEMAETYRAAREAEEAGDWEAAARGYALIQDGPGFGDAAARREACTARQRVTDLQDELRIHAGAGNWQAAFDVSGELEAIDPAAADPDGLTTRARMELFSSRAHRSDVFEMAPPERTEDSSPTGSDQYHSAVDRVALGATKIREFRHGKAVNAVAFNQDGTRLATGSSDKALRVWRADTDANPLKVTIGSGVQSVAFSPDGTRLATGSSDKTSRIWNASNGQGMLTLKTKTGLVATSIWTVSFSPDGTCLATGSDDKTARIWNASNGTELLRVSHNNRVFAVAFSPDGTRLATGSLDNTARIWDIRTGAELLRLKHGQLIAWVMSVAFSPDGKKLATGSENQAVCIWDTETGAQILKVSPEMGGVRAVAFSPDGKRLATGSDGGTASIWDTDTGAQLLAVKHDKSVGAVAFSPDGKRLATGSDDKTACIWDISEAERASDEED